MTAADQQALGVIDLVVPEPGEGAHAEPAETARRLQADHRRPARPRSTALPLDELARGALPALPRARRRTLRSTSREPPPPPVRRTRRPPARPARAGPARRRSVRAVAAARRAAGARGGLASARIDPVRRQQPRQRRPQPRLTDRRDHAAIDRLAVELLPALIAKLGGDRPRRARGPRGRLAGPPAPARRRRSRAAIAAPVIGTRDRASRGAAGRGSTVTPGMARGRVASPG